MLAQELKNKQFELEEQNLEQVKGKITEIQKNIAQNITNPSELL